MAKSAFGVVGLGRIGGGLSLQALAKGWEVHGFDTAGASEKLTAAGLQSHGTLAELVQALPTPKILFLYIHAGGLLDQTMVGLLPNLSAGDIVVDGGNSYWGDSIRRGKQFSPHGVHWVDLGTSGGVAGAETGACFMAGGDPKAVATIEPILRDLAVPGGFVYAGASGSGHFVKLVHNGVEFGMLQAIGEGVALMEKFPCDLPISEVLQCWQNGSVVRSWLIDLMAEAYVHQGALAATPDHVEDTGEVNWLVADALHLETPIPVISQSIMELFRSRDQARNDYRAIALMRRGFGGHPLGPQPSLASERITSRVGEYYRFGKD